MSFRVYKEEADDTPEHDIPPDQASVTIKSSASSQYLRVILHKRNRGYSTVIFFEMVKSISGVVAAIYFRPKVPHDDNIIKAIISGDVAKVKQIIEGGENTANDITDDAYHADGVPDNISLFEVRVCLFFTSSIS